MLSLKQVLSTIRQKPFSSNKYSFGNIEGHLDIKSILGQAILAKRPVHVLLVGTPGSAKTMFLTEIMKVVKESYFVVGSNTTKAGLVNQLFEKTPKFLLIDELEKMTKADQSSLLHVMETGIISETKIKKTRQTKLITWVFATANSCDNIIEPLLSRFVVLEIPEYSFEEFNKIAHSMLAKENVESELVDVIVKMVWNGLGSKDIRDVVKIARLARDATDVYRIIPMMRKNRNE